ncbi:MAG: hypothetical protein ACFE9A_07410 [Candidatus Hodarchaeota archaeon]
MEQSDLRYQWHVKTIPARQSETCALRSRQQYSPFRIWSGYKDTFLSTPGTGDHFEYKRG